MAEGMRWRVTKAVRRSDLPAPARHVMLTLADVAEVGTAEIPAQHTPSLAVLARETGLNESTVKRHLNTLEADGWLVRTRPTIEAARLNGERTRYRLTMPQGAESAVEGAEEAQEGAQEAQPRAQREPSPGRTPRPSKRSDPSQTTIRSKDLVEPERPDVEKLCQHLADRIAANGSKRPTVTDAWRKEARLMLDKDGRPFEHVMGAIDWCQNHHFWKANVLSMPKLREQYDRLRLVAETERARASTTGSTTDDRVSAALALKGRFTDERAIS